MSRDEFGSYSFVANLHDPSPLWSSRFALVLFGRGRPFQDHIGNKYLARLVDEHKTVYTSSENHDKTTISWLLVDKVKENNGRFLKRVEDSKTGDIWWEEVSHDIARAKVTKSFRADLSRKTPKSKGMNDM